jgi:hypothetical protein
MYTAIRVPREGHKEEGVRVDVDVFIDIPFSSIYPIW